MADLKDFDCGMIVGIGLGTLMSMFPLSFWTRGIAGTIIIILGLYLLLRSKK